MELPATMRSWIIITPSRSSVGGFTGAKAQIRRLSRGPGPASPSGIASTFTT